MLTQVEMLDLDAMALPNLIPSAYRPRTRTALHACSLTEACDSQSQMEDMVCR